MDGMYIVYGILRKNNKTERRFKNINEEIKKDAETWIHQRIIPRSRLFCIDVCSNLSICGYIRNIHKYEQEKDLPDQSCACQFVPIKPCSESFWNVLGKSQTKMFQLFENITPQLGRGPGRRHKLARNKQLLYKFYILSPARTFTSWA